MVYKLCGVDRKRRMNWKEYAMSLIVTNFIMMVISLVVLSTQGINLLNPNGIENLKLVLGFNTVVSFMTNTNLQHYAGESSLSYLSTMLVIIFMMFVSSASGYAVCMAFIRGLVGKTKNDMGNFFEDLIRITTRVLIPFSFIIGLILVSQGVIQNFSENTVVNTIEGTKQVIQMGPAAALESIKHLGTNGGGFIGGNSSTPIENPNIITNITELYSMMLIPGSMVVVFGKMLRDRVHEGEKEKKNILIKKFEDDVLDTWDIKAKDRKHKNNAAPKKKEKSEGRMIFVAMSIIFVLGLALCFWSESKGNPILKNLGLSQTMGSMEGKEVRFGIAQSSLFTAVTTSFTTGTVNNMHDSLTPLGGLVPLLNMMLNVVFGGAGVGLMNMILYAILGVFICGLMIGRTPEYLGKKIEGREMKLTSLAIIIHPFFILLFTAIALSTSQGIAGITNGGFHGITQIVYEYASAAANNGSGFEGLNDNTIFWNISTGIVMLLSRYIPIVLQLAIAGNLMKKRFVVESPGTLKTDGLNFSMILVFVVFVFAALTFLPVLILGPVSEFLSMV